MRSFSGDRTVNYTKICNIRSHHLIPNDRSTPDDNHQIRQAQGQALEVCNLYSNHRLAQGSAIWFPHPPLSHARHPSDLPCNTHKPRTCMPRSRTPSRLSRTRPVAALNGAWSIVRIFVARRLVQPRMPTRQCPEQILAHIRCCVIGRCEI